MKKGLLGLLIIGIIFITGCGITTSKYSKPISLTYDKYNEKLENKESFAMLIWRTGCTHCEEFEPKLNKVIKKYDLEVYSINTSDLSDGEYAKLKNKTFVTGTPTLVVFEKGKYHTRLVGDKDEDVLINFLKENNYIR